MGFFHREQAQSLGFAGFVPFAFLRARRGEIPKAQGVYLVFAPDGFKAGFLQKGTGGFFKGRDPNVSVAELAENWVEKSNLLYIGKAGGPGLGSTLESRIMTFESFGRGVRAAHHGGRYLWQLRDSQELLICWKPTLERPRAVETALIQDFKTKFGRRPFANLRG